MQFALSDLRGHHFRAALVAIFIAALQTGCHRTGDASALGKFRMGERVQIGPLTYTVLEAQWKPSLTESDVTHPPKNRYLFLKISAANSGGQTATMPSFQLEGTNRQTYPEITEGVQDVPNWLGVLRRVPPSRTEQGIIIFDAPIAAYQLLISDGGDVGSEKYAQVDVPVQLE